MVDYIIGIGTAVLVIGIVVKALIDKKNGKPIGDGCSGNCSSCGGSCHANFDFLTKE
jgi:hypothetical protein